MIQKVTIKNFQSHKNTSLEFSKNVNVIVGNSDCGKSAIIRALRWVLYNQPRGDSFRSHWGGDTEVEICTDSIIVKRIKTNTKNLYILIQGEKQLKFAAFGNDVPEEIKQALNFDEINLQQQLDAPFLISSTAGEVSHHFNRMADLEKIDDSTKNIQIKIRQISQTIKGKKVELENVQEKYKQYDFVDELEKDITGLENLDIKKNKLSMECSLIFSSIQNIKKLKEKINICEKFLLPEQKILDILDLYDKKEIKNNLKINLLSQINSIKELNILIEQKNKNKNAENLINDLIILFQQKEEKQKLVNSISSLVDNIDFIDKKIKKEKQQKEEKQKLFDELMPDICPLCGK